MEFGSVSWKPFRTVLVKPVLKSGDKLIGVRHVVGHDAFWVKEVNEVKVIYMLMKLKINGVSLSSLNTYRTKIPNLRLTNKLERVGGPS